MKLHERDGYGLLFHNTRWVLNFNFLKFIAHISYFYLDFNLRFFNSSNVIFINFLIFCIFFFLFTDQTGRNIRHLPCIVKRSGHEGVCMFAIDCLKSNGTHLGTCIDRFYFGSCCQLKVDELFVDHEISDNSIDENTISHFPSFPTTNIDRPLVPISTISVTSTSSSHQSRPTTAVHSTSINYELISSSTTRPSQKLPPQKISTTTSFVVVKKPNITATTEKVVATTLQPLKDEVVSTESIKLQTYQSVTNDEQPTTHKTTEKPKVATTTTTTTTPKTTKRPRPRPTITSTRKPTRTTARPRTTKVPYTKRTTIASTIRPRPTKRTTTPKTTTEKITLNKVPILQDEKPITSQKPPRRTTTIKPVITTPVTTTEKVVITTTQKTTTTKKPVTTTTTTEKVINSWKIYLKILYNFFFTQI